MSTHKMAYKMADTEVYAAVTRAEYGSGGLYQRTSDWRWLAVFEAGFTASGD